MIIVTSYHQNITLFLFGNFSFFADTRQRTGKNTHLHSKAALSDALCGTAPRADKVEDTTNYSARIDSAGTAPRADKVEGTTNYSARIDSAGTAPRADR